MSGTWLNGMDSDRVGKLYLAVVVVTFVLGGVMALFLHTELASAGDTLLSSVEFGRFLSAHGLLMIFLFLAPAIPAVFGNLVLPRLLGAEATALPALGVMSWLLYALGALVIVPAALFGGLEGGWDFFAVFQAGAAPGLAATLLTLGVSLTAASLVCNGVNFILTIHRRPDASTGFYDLPVLAWTLYATAVVHILATVALVVTVTIISADAKAAGGLIDPAAGGDPGLPARWFWMFAHPFVYVSLLPAVGVITETLARTARQRAFAPRATAAAVVLYAALVCLTWGQHLFGSGDDLADTVHSGLALLTIVPAALFAMNWLGTLYGGAIRLSTAFWYALAAVAMLAVAGVSGLLTATPGPGAMLRGTLFAGAQFHYLVGGILFAFLAGLHMWWTVLFGRRPAEGSGTLGALLIVVGYNAAFAPRLLMGLRGATKGWSGPPGDLGILSVVGGGLLVVGLAVAVWSLLAAYRGGAPVAGAAD